ncbi:PREDICTED: uncharacterized protein LOC104609345 [Nelumbo nucifera]|uniref:Uncharacterized protein LOC104609345 n=2 Tax=Nelumbo nucifera TaxID=4432 RepID=A0A1U8BBN2_NELNU|nr:PREDICTED: uncharacterized protein LOC104609345 [Nelumbo nucifera]XP_010273937.1 PREDICTED: uncharacterized protein LOC104609345 [Nelumbo nucifera]DAD49085.1 TPA_asm: hypothetical protein HUJ06_019022 [Nelumbo nucifera]
MASTSAVSMAMPLTSASHKRVSIGSEAFLKPLPVRPSKAMATTTSRAGSKLQVRASLKEKAVTGLTAAALTASMVIPEVAEAAGSGITPSLKNFLLSIVAGGVVLSVIVGAVIGVANFDPVKRS